MVYTLFALSLLAVKPNNIPINAQMTLITKQGLEISTNLPVLRLFSALNALGYAEEPRRLGPPTFAPQFGELRAELRQTLRARSKSITIKNLAALFEQHPLSISEYIRATLVSGPPQSLAKKLTVLDTFGSEIDFEKKSIELLPKLRRRMFQLKTALEKDTDSATNLIGHSFVRPDNTHIMLNPYDGHELAHKVQFDTQVFISLGPGQDFQRRSALEASLLPTLAKLIESIYTRALPLAQQWRYLKTIKTITEHWSSGPEYLTAALAKAIAHRVVTTNLHVAHELDTLFVQTQAEQGMKWAGIGLKLIDACGQRPLASVLPNAIAKIQP